MNRPVIVLLVSVFASSASAADLVPALSEESAVRRAPAAPTQGVLAASSAREVSRIVRSMAPEPRRPQPTRQPSANSGWIARHPKLFGALIGFGVGCAVASSRVGGSEDTFFNALDESACFVVGGIGAGGGALVGSLFK